MTIAHHTTSPVADPPWGILFMLMLSSIAVYGVMLAGWSSGSKYPLLGAVRASAQMISYEAALGLSIATVVVLSASLHTGAIVPPSTAARGSPCPCPVEPVPQLGRARSSSS